MLLSRRSFLAASTSAAVIGARFVQAQTTSRPVEIIGARGSEVDAIRSLLFEFMDKYEVPGLSLAMTFGGQLKLLACCGFADQEHVTPVTPQHRFRVASVSKPITSIAIMKLIERRNLSLHDKVFGQGILDYSAELVALGEENERRLKEITVQQLLEHACGGWGNSNRDPMFVSEALNFSHAELIRWTLNNAPLPHEPGSTYDYSNFGYCLLGRIIEKKTGKSYAEAVKSLILEPGGINKSSFAIGGNTLAERLENEVVYYGQQEDPYHQIMNVTRMDSHGGWVATPTDLVKLALRADGFGKPRDVLSPGALKTMVTPSQANSGYAKGWSVNRSNNWWHTGSFNGGSSILARISDRHCWALTINTRSKKQGYFSDLDKLPWDVKKCITLWGHHDLFRHS